MTFSRLWLLATIPTLIGAVVLIVRLAVGIVRSTQEAIVASLPVVAKQSVVLPFNDRYVILVQGGLGERGLGDLRFSVADERDARELRISPVYVRSSSSSLDGTVRLELFTFVAAPGPHSLLTLGIDPTRDYTRNRVIIARRSRGALAFRIVALVLTSIVTLGSLVATSLLIVGRR